MATPPLPSERGSGDNTRPHTVQFLPNRSEGNVAVKNALQRRADRNHIRTGAVCEYHQTPLGGLRVPDVTLLIFMPILVQSVTGRDTLKQVWSHARSIIANLTRA